MYTKQDLEESDEEADIEDADWRVPTGEETDQSAKSGKQKKATSEKKTPTSGGANQLCQRVPSLTCDF